MSILQGFISRCFGNSGVLALFKIALILQFWAFCRVATKEYIQHLYLVMEINSVKFPFKNLLVFISGYTEIFGLQIFRPKRCFDQKFMDLSFEVAPKRPKNGPKSDEKIAKNLKCLLLPKYC